MRKKAFPLTKKKLRSKIGYTLVELVVTMAIISITAGMGVGVFASTMKNYLTASVTSQEQAKALQIESYIVSNARVATGIAFVRPEEDPDGDPVREDKNEYKTVADAIAAQPESSIWTYLVSAQDSEVLDTYDVEKTSVATHTTTDTLSYDGVDRIDFSYKLHSTEKANNTDVDTYFIILQYEIRMKEGYVLKGSAVMNNCTSNVGIVAGDSFVMSRASKRSVGGSSPATAIIFIK